MEETTHEQAIRDLRCLVEHRARVEEDASSELVEALARHRAQGVPWTVLAEGLGVRKQTAHKVWAHQVARRLEGGTPVRGRRHHAPNHHRKASPS